MATITSPTVQSIIDLARQYVDDNNKVTDGWKTPDDWLKWVKTDYIQCCRKWMREGIVSFATIEVTFNDTQLMFGSGDLVPNTTEPLAVVGVAENLGTGRFRRLAPIQASLGRSPFYSNENAFVFPGRATGWGMEFQGALTGSGGLGLNDIPGLWLLKVYPEVAGNYVVKYVPSPQLDIVTVDSFLHVPYGMDNYIALRVARKALASEGASSQALERLITLDEAEWKMTSLGQVSGDGPKVRINPKRPRFGGLTGDFTPWSTNPYEWYYF
jgi:hypothetical protein